MILCRSDDQCQEFPTPENTVKVAVDRSESENVEVCFNHFPPGCVARRHRHAGREQVYYVVRGTGTAYIGGEQVTLEPGKIVYVPRGVEHSTTADAREELMYVVFNAFSPGSDERKRGTFAEHYRHVLDEIESLHGKKRDGHSLRSTK